MNHSPTFVAVNIDGLGRAAWVQTELASPGRFVGSLAADCHAACGREVEVVEGMPVLASPWHAVSALAAMLAVAGNRGWTLFHAPPELAEAVRWRGSVGVVREQHNAPAANATPGR